MITLIRGSRHSLGSEGQPFLKIFFFFLFHLKYSTKTGKGVPWGEICWVWHNAGGSRLPHTVETACANALRSEGEC